MYDITLDENMKDLIFFPAQSKPLVEVRLKQAFLQIFIITVYFWYYLKDTLPQI